MRRRPLAPWTSPWVLMLLLLTLVAAACGGDDDSDSVADPPTTAGKLAGEITVLAAASLADSFKELATAFAAAHPGATVRFSFDSSSSLATQANQGAPADVFASADDVNMKKVTDTGTAAKPRTFTRNRLAILVGKGNPLGIAGLADFDRPEVRFVLCADGVPCGTYGKEALTNAGVKAEPKSFENNVKGVVTKVTSGEADAGIVYVTDARAAAGNSDSVDIPDALNVTANYPVATLKQSSKPDVAAAFVDFLISPTGQGILARHGFLPAS